MTKTPSAAAKAAKPVGRPSTFSQELADVICERLVGGESLRRICLDEAFPDKVTVGRWLLKLDAFRTQYTRARELQADTLFDESLDIADETEIGEVRTTKADGSIETRTEDMLGHRRLRIDTRKWMAGKLAPKKYGERQTVEHTDPDGNNPFAALMDAVGANGRPRPASAD